LSEPIELIAREKHSGATFGLGYWLLQFDGPMLNVHLASHRVRASTPVNVLQMMKDAKDLPEQNYQAF
jgi:hypothetical protein